MTEDELRFASYSFVDEVLHKSAGITNGSIVWSGWVLREAFEAGAKWQKEHEVDNHD